MNYFQKLFYFTFVYEKRYLIFLRGFYTTLLLSIASFICGTLFGILLCAMKRSNNKILIKIADVMIALLINIPTMVLLLVFVYVIFGSISAPLAIIVILALTMKTGSYICEIINTALDAVDPGEIEAARTLGMTSRQTFIYITMPHVISTGLELYKNQFILNMQETAVVGYVALVDLTRASSIVGARTMDSLLALLAISVIYFVIGIAFKKLFNLMRIEKHIGV
ncbi:ABC transporter permease subunit [Butyrivibrio sp. AC2005]|uniref:ABC transporter permease subunit n=1 Tax=Butyrivibrio sp. AC2005 TaxID=1280672 RepID=UPI000409570B|nr:ABC transporter permease subunit [Butyrivibrio sp. AC2005]